MLAILEKSLPRYVSCDFDIENPAGRANRARQNAPESPGSTEDFVPASPVVLPEVRRLDASQALAEARLNVAAALKDLLKIEQALEARLTGLQEHMSRRCAAPQAES